MMAEIMADQDESSDSEYSSTFDSEDAQQIEIENKKIDRIYRQQQEEQSRDDSSDEKSESTTTTTTTTTMQPQIYQTQTQQATARAKKLEKQQKQMQQQHQSDREALIKKLQGSKQKSGAKCSDETYMKFMAQNIVQNQSIRQKQSSQLAQDAKQEQELFEKQQAVFTDYAAYSCRIQAQTFLDTFKAVLYQQLGYNTVNVLIKCFKENKGVQEFEATIQSKLPEGLVFDQLKKSYQQTLQAQGEYNELVRKYKETKSEKYFIQLYQFPSQIKNYWKIDYRDGRLSKLTKTLDIFPQSQLERVAKGEITKEKLLQEKMLSQAKTPEEKQQILQQQEEMQRQKIRLAEIQEKSKENKSYQKEFKTDVAEYSKRTSKINQLYNHVYTRNPIQDQSNYIVTPNSVACQTDYSLIEGKQKIQQYKIILDPAKRSQFQIYCVLTEDKRIIDTQRNVQTQTEIYARQIKNGEISIRHYKVQAPDIYAYIDTEKILLNRIDIGSVEQKLKSCKKVTIDKPSKGKLPQGYQDFLILLRKVRPDIYDRGDLYKQSDEEVKKVNLIPNGCWPTLDGVLDQSEDGIYQIIDTPQHEFGIFTNDILDMNVLNGHDFPSFLDKFYYVVDDQQQEETLKEELKQKQKEEKYYRSYKYFEPLTGLGYNNQEEYQQIQQIIQNEINIIQQNIDNLTQEREEFLKQKDFRQAGIISKNLESQKYELDAITNQWKQDKDIVIYDKETNKFLYRPIDQKRVVQLNQVDVLINPWLIL